MPNNATPFPCQQCGKPESVRKDRRYCSPKCYYDSMKGQPKPAWLGPALGKGGAKIRGVPQSEEHVTRRRESLERTLAATRRPCVECGDEFTPTQAAQRYCSGRCWNAASRRKKERNPVVKIPKAEYARLVMEHGATCGICGAPSGTNARGDRLAVDHDHATGRIRGLLCHRCNTAIGLLRDDAELLEQAIHYLTKHGTTE